MSSTPNPINRDRSHGLGQCQNLRSSGLEILRSRSSPAYRNSMSESQAEVKFPNRSDSGASIINMVSIGAVATFIAAREEFSHFRSTPFRSQVFGQPRDKSCTAFRSVNSTSVNPFGSRDFSAPVFASGSSYARVHGFVARLWRNSNFR